MFVLFNTLKGTLHPKELLNFFSNSIARGGQNVTTPMQYWCSNALVNLHNIQTYNLI
jgi:hypothetical protein